LCISWNTIRMLPAEWTFGFIKITSEWLETQRTKNIPVWLFKHKFTIYDINSFFVFELWCYMACVDWNLIIWNLNSVEAIRLIILTHTHIIPPWWKGLFLLYIQYLIYIYILLSKYNIFTKVTSHHGSLMALHHLNNTSWVRVSLFLDYRCIIITTSVLCY